MFLVINNQQVEFPEALNEVSLVDVIRDYIGLKGTKFGCGKGLCGACTIHLDGVAVRSCQLTPKAVANQKITTIEGLSGISSDDDSLHPVQRAWVEQSVPQCGYCQPGQIMTAASFVSRNHNPSVEQIEAAMSGNLCRCGTYQRIRTAVQRAAEIIRTAEEGADDDD